MESDRLSVPGVLVGEPQEWGCGCGHSCDFLQQKGSRLLAAEGRGTWGGVQGRGPAGAPPGEATQHTHSSFLQELRQLVGSASHQGHSADSALRAAEEQD